MYLYIYTHIYMCVYRRSYLKFSAYCKIFYIYEMLPQLSTLINYSNLSSNYIYIYIYTIIIYFWTFKFLRQKAFEPLNQMTSNFLGYLIYSGKMHIYKKNVKFIEFFCLKFYCFLIRIPFFGPQTP